MIVRIWKGRARPAMAGAYQEHVTAVVFPKLTAIDGYLGGRVLRRTVGNDVEFVVCTDWASMDAIRAFAGRTPDRAVVEPEARAVLSEFDEHVQHFEVAHDHHAIGR